MAAPVGPKKVKRYSDGAACLPDLCPGCVQHGLPQAQRIHALFDPREVAVVRLHTVFEHHEAMTLMALRAFVHEYRIAFPVGVDVLGTDGPVPQTMRAYGLRATPPLQH